jgi:hypothetical protein
VSEPDEPEVLVPRELSAGAWADYVDVFGDFAELTIDFARLDPRMQSRGILVARVAASRWCILKLHHELTKRVQ